MDKLLENAHFTNEYCESCILLFTDTWMHDSIVWTLSKLTYQFLCVVRFYRDSANCGKHREGRLCLFVKDK